MTNKVRVSGILINPVGEPISGAVITFTSVTNSLSVLSGESASINTNTEGSYSTELSYGEYSITISRAGKNSLYGAITIADTTGPSTINELLKQQIMETEVTPDVILYFRQIQKQVAGDLATMKVLNDEAFDAATRAGEYRDEAGRYAADLSDAVATARRYRDEAGKSAADSLASEQKSKQSETNAQSSETNSAESERNALIYKNTAVAAAETAAEDASTLAAEKTEQKITAAVKQDADRAELARDESESIQADVTTKFNQVNANTTATLTARNEAVNAATSAGQSATTSTNNANATAQDRLAIAADKQQVSADKAASQSAASTATTKAQLATTEANRASTEADRAVAALTGKQDKSQLLTSMSGLTTAANQLIYLTDKDATATTAISEFGRKFIAAKTLGVAREVIGAIPAWMPIACPMADVPAGYLKCNGAAFDKEMYPELAVGYPAGKLPDLRGEFIRGWDDGRGVDSGRGIISSQGDAIRNIKSVYNTRPYDYAGATASIYLSSPNSGPISITQVPSTIGPIGPITGTTSGSKTVMDSLTFDASNVVPTAAENRPRNIAFLYIVRAA